MLLIIFIFILITIYLIWLMVKTCIVGTMIGLAFIGSFIESFTNKKEEPNAQLRRDAKPATEWANRMQDILDGKVKVI